MIVLSMLVSIFPLNAITAFADDGRLTDGSTKADIIYDYMNFKSDYDLAENGGSYTDADGAYANDHKSIVAEKVSTPDRADIHQGDVFVLGIRISNLKSIRAGADGIFNMSIPFHFNSEYIALVDGEENNYSADMPNRLGGRKNQESIYSSTMGYGVGEGNINTNVITYALKSRTPSYTGDSDAYVALFYFKFLKDGSEIPDGTKIIEHESDNTDFNIGFGSNGSSASYEYSEDDDSIDIRPLFNIDTSSVNVAPATYTVSYYDSYDETTKTYGNHIVNKDTKVAEDSSLSSISGASLPTSADFTVPSGKFIDKWYYIPSDTGIATEFTTATKIKEDTKVYATYVNGHTVTFNSNYPSGAQKTKDVTVSPKAGATIAETQKPTVGTSSDDFETPAGYTFEGWFTQANGGDEIVFDDGTNTSSATDVSSITDVYAHWVQNVTVTFHENYGQTENTTNKTISAGSSLKSSDIPTFTRANYAFKEWNTKADGSGTTYSNTQLQAETISSNTDYYAMWTPENPDNAVTLTFSPTGCDAQVTPASMTVVRGDTIYAYQMPTPTKTSATGDAYTFNGWYGAASESDTTDKAPFTLTDNKTVYAHWTYAGRDQVTVTFDYDGATSPTAPTTITVGKGDSIGDAMPTTPVKTNYSFDKWVNTADNSDFDKTTTVNSDITVKATYKSDITVNFNINDGTTPATPFATDKGAPSKSYTAPSDPTRANYTFVGWNTKANGSGKFITAADYATLNDVSTAAGGTNPVELYAYWADAPVTPGKLPGNETPNDNGVKVTFDSNASGSASSTVTDANPKYVYPHLGDALGTLMPEAPTRTN